MRGVLFRALAAAAIVTWSALGTTASAVLDASAPGVVHRGGVWSVAGRPFTGLLVERDASRSVRMTVTLTDGREDGTEWRWYENGQLESVRAYAGGRKVGHHRGWWSDGTPRFDASYKDDGFDGTYRAWHANGRLSDVRTFFDGRENGIQQGWAPDGALYFNYEVRGGRRYGLINAKPCIPTGKELS